MAAELVVPKLGESISEAVIGKWLKNVGEAISIDEPVVDLETDKVSVALPAPAAGVLSEQRFAVGATVKIGDVIGAIDVSGAAPTVSLPTTAAKTTPAVAPVAVAVVDSTPVKAAPALTVSDASVPHSKTLPPSVRKAIREGAQLVPGGATSTPSVADEVVPMSPLRKRIAERLVEAQHTAAILTTFNEVDMSAIISLRAKLGEAFLKSHGVKLGFMSLFVKACVASCKAFPGLNAEMRGTDIIYKKRYDFGIAVGSGRGLVVPVVRNVDHKSLAEIESDIAKLGQRAKDNQLTLDDLSGGTFSITNGGIYGSMMSTPLLNMPQTGILGMHNIIKRPVAVGDEIALRPMMYLALSYDHRVADGREAVQFLVGVKERLESPDRLLLEI